MHDKVFSRRLSARTCTVELAKCAQRFKDRTPLAVSLMLQRIPAQFVKFSREPKPRLDSNFANIQIIVKK